MTTAWLPPDHDRWADATGAYLLHALTRDEEAGFESHLERCSLCRQEVRELRVATDALPGSVEQYAPPPELKQRIMAIVEAEAAQSRAATRPAGAAKVSSRRSWREILLRPVHVRPAILVPALSALLVLGVLTGVLLRGDDAVRPTTVVAEVDVRGASAELVLYGDHTRLLVSGLPELDNGHVYQVWLKPPGEGPEPTNALFSVRPDGTASVAVPGSLEGMEAVLVTEEPDGGSIQPSGTPLISASLS